jgi:hypothetical protein
MEIRIDLLPWPSETLVKEGANHPVTFIEQI